MLGWLRRFTAVQPEGTARLSTHSVCACHEKRYLFFGSSSWRAVPWKSLTPLTGHADGGELGCSSAVCACDAGCYTTFFDDSQFLVPGKLCTPLCGWTRGRNWGGMCRILSLCSEASETVRALVLCARCWKCGPGSPAATALVTGGVLIPLRRVL